MPLRNERGLPTRVFSGGGKVRYPDDAMETPDTLMATYAYDDFNIIWDHACGINHGLYNRKKEGSVLWGEWYNGTRQGRLGKSYRSYPIT